MITEIKNIKDPTIRERFDRLIVVPALKTKIALGAALRLSDELREIRANEIHKEFRKPRNYLKVKVHAKDHIWSADLIEMPHDRGYKFILTVIDLYTRFAWVIALQNKTGQLISNAFKELFKKSNRVPSHLWTDKGK